MKKTFTKSLFLSVLMAFGFTFASAQAETVTYAVPQGETHDAGSTVDVTANDETVATLTFGFEGGAQFKAPKQDDKRFSGFYGYCEGNGENGTADSGTVYIITPKYNGEIEVGIVLNAGKAFFILEDDVALADYDGMKTDAKVQTFYKFNAIGGKSYKVYCTGSKLGFYGFNYTFTIPSGEDPVDPNEPTEGTLSAGVKMTYVNYDDPTTPMGEIPAGEIAKAGYNKISGGQVGFVNTGWGCNWITYLQVDASEAKGNITKATLSFQASGSTDGKRATTWGAGYNSSVWSDEMTYETADKSITTVGSEQTAGSNKSLTTFTNVELDITDALKNAEGKIATILIYETAAAGGHIKNPTVNVDWTTAATYAVTFTETAGVKATVTVDGSDVTEGANLANGTYSFTATATGYKDYTGEFTVSGADLNVEFTMTPKEVWSYTVNGVDAEGNDLGQVNEGTGYEEDNVTYHYPEFVLKEGTLYSKANNKSNPYWGAVEKLDVNNKSFTVTYNGATISDVVFYKEAEEMEGFTARNTNNADIRCSNGLGGTADSEEALLTTLPAGKYTIFGQVWGPTGLTAGVQIKDDVEAIKLWELASTGSLTNSTSEEFELSKETELYVYTNGGTSTRMLDLIYIVKTGDVDPGVKVTSITLNKTNISKMDGNTVQLIATYEPADATNADFVWTSSNEKVATVTQTGLVALKGDGTCVITVATADGSVSAECTVNVITGVEGVEEDGAPVSVYSVNGVAMGNSLDNLAAGIYIIRKGAKVYKVTVK